MLFRSHYLMISDEKIYGCQGPLCSNNWVWKIEMQISLPPVPDLRPTVVHCWSGWCGLKGGGGRSGEIRLQTNNILISRGSFWRQNMFGGFEEARGSKNRQESSQKRVKGMSN